MMAYAIEYSSQAERDLDKLDKPVLLALRKRLDKFAQDADDVVHMPLKGQYAGLYKLRFYGKYRVIYDLKRDEHIIVVVRVGKRDEIYDK